MRILDAAFEQRRREVVAEDLLLDQGTKIFPAPSGSSIDDRIGNSQMLQPIPFLVVFQVER